MVSLPGQAAGRDAPPLPRPADQRAEYTRADMARALEGREFAGLTGAVEEKLGKKLTTPDLAILLGLYDQLGLPADVVFLLVGFCAERTAQRYGEGRRPTMRQIEKEGYTWARLGLMTQESAAAYIKKYQRSREAMPRTATKKRSPTILNTQAINTASRGVLESPIPRKTLPSTL